MKNIVFVDRIGEIYNGDVVSAKEHYEKYKDLSMRGIGAFAEKDVYLLGEKGEILNSYGKTIFNNGGAVTDTENSDTIINDFIVGKKINNVRVKSLGFMALQNVADGMLIYKSSDGELPIVKIKDGSATFFKSSFTNSDYIKRMEDTFKKTCIKNGVKFNIQ